MANYREIVTKAVISKGKKLFKSNHEIEVENPSTVLGCWVINHNFKGSKSGRDISIDGSYDVNIWYSYDNDTKTNVVKQTNEYHEIVHMREVDDVLNEEIIVRSLKQPNCVKIDLDNGKIVYSIEKELGIELVGDVKVKVEANDDEDNWDEIVEENVDNSEIDKVDEEFIEDTI